MIFQYISTTRTIISDISEFYCTWNGPILFMGSRKTSQIHMLYVINLHWHICNWQHHDRRRLELAETGSNEFFVVTHGTDTKLNTSEKIRCRVQNAIGNEHDVAPKLPLPLRKMSARKREYLWSSVRVIMLIRVTKMLYEARISKYSVFHVPSTQIWLYNTLISSTY